MAQDEDIHRPLRFYVIVTNIIIYTEWMMREALKKIIILYYYFLGLVIIFHTDSGRVYIDIVLSSWVYFEDAILSFETHRHQFCKTQWRHRKPFWMGTRWKQSYIRPPPPYSIVLTSSVTAMEVKDIEFHRISVLHKKIKCIRVYYICLVICVYMSMFICRAGVCICVLY